MTIPWHAFGSSLESLIRQQPARLRDAVAISPLASAESRRAAFRLQFSDGRVLKGRYLETAQQGETVWRLSNEHLALGARRPRHRAAFRSVARGMVARIPAGGRLQSACESARGRRAARSTSSDSVAGCESRRALEPRWIDDSLDADRLVAAGRLDPAAAREAASLARQSAPAIAEWGFCHGDFCAENLLIVPALGLHVVDNETICELWLDYDLARTWYRWPMDALSFREFLDGYRLHRAADEFLAHFAFWTIAVLLRSAAFRLRNGVSSELPIQRLKSLLQAPSPPPLWESR